VQVDFFSQMNISFATNYHLPTTNLFSIPLLFSILNEENLKTSTKT